MKLDFYADPGHGWLKVPRKLLHQLDIAEKITVSSYELGEYVYLEEDCDCQTFYEAVEKAGIAVEVRHHHTYGRSWIRSYFHYSN